MGESQKRCNIYIGNQDDAKLQWEEHVKRCNDYTYRKEPNYRDYIFKYINGLSTINIYPDAKNMFFRTVQWEVKALEDFIPTKIKCKAGRANEEHQVHLYVSNELSTSIKESKVLDKVNLKVCKYKPQHKLKILNFYIDSDSYNVKMKTFRSILDKEFSKPTNPKDKESDYWSTQVITKYIKEKLHYDGIKYSSSLEKSNGYNIVLFNAEDFQPIYWGNINKFIPESLF